MSTLSPGTPLQGGKYRIEETLAQSSAGITYLATWVAYNLRVCIKEFFMKEYCERASNTTNVTLTSYVAVEPHLYKFQQEAQVISRLDHPNIIRIHDRFEENNTAYYVMEFVEGPSLADIVRMHGHLDENSALHYVRQVGEALHYIHEQGISHQSVQPHHIMLRHRDDKPILIDFGTGRPYEGSRRIFSPQSDIRSLAATLYELLTGQTPPTDVAAGAPLPMEGLEHVRPVIIGAIEAALQYNAPGHPESIMELLEQLELTAPKLLPDSADYDDVEEEEDDDSIPLLQPEAEKTRIKIHSAPEEKLEEKPAAPVQSTPSKKGKQHSKGKTAAELQREKYNEVSKQFAQNMARNHKKDKSAIGFVIVLGVLFILAVAAYFIFA